MKTVCCRILRVLILIFIFVLTIVGYVFHEKTLVSWWILIGVALLVVAITFPFYNKWQWLTVSDSKAFNMICHLVCTGGISYALFLGGNYLPANSDSQYQEKVMVQNKYVETYQKRRRIGKHSYREDGVLMKYYLQVLFDNGETKDLHVSLSTYNKAQKNAPKLLTLKKGFLGLPVVTNGL